MALDVAFPHATWQRTWPSLPVASLVQEVLALIDEAGIAPPPDDVATYFHNTAMLAWVCPSGDLVTLEISPTTYYVEHIASDWFVMSLVCATPVAAVEELFLLLQQAT